MTQRPTEFVVRRSTWLRGQEGGSVLLDRRGCMCCLGFVARQCGMAPDVLLANATPGCVAWERNADMEPIASILVEPAGTDDFGNELWGDSQLANNAIALNDGLELGDPERESELTQLFAAHGYMLRFEP